MIKSPKIPDAPPAIPWIIRVIEFLSLSLVSLWVFAIGRHIISIPFFCVWLYVYWFSAANRYFMRSLTAWLIFIATSVIPVDIDIGGWHGPRWGDSPGGIHFVRLEMGMPALPTSTQKFDEFISGGCCVGGLEPTWVLVWN